MHNFKISISDLIISFVRQQDIETAVTWRVAQQRQGKAMPVAGRGGL
jgi:hypothetical protein